MKGAKSLMQDDQDMYACRNNDFFSCKYFNGGLYKQLKGYFDWKILLASYINMKTMTISFFL